MSLSQIHVLDKIVERRHRNIKREYKIKKIKRNIFDKFNDVVDDVFNFVNALFYSNNKKLAYAKRK